MLGPKARQRFDRQVLEVEKALLPPAPWRRNDHEGRPSFPCSSWRFLVSLKSTFTFTHAPEYRVRAVEIFLLVGAGVWNRW